MRTWRAMDRAPHDGRWIIAIHRSDPDRRAVIRWDPAGLSDPRPWHVASCQHSYPADAFTDCRSFYAEAGFPYEWRSHHQGGMAGYATRELVATAETRQEIEPGMAFAWNPSLPGAKAEETFVLTKDGPPEVICS